MLGLPVFDWSAQVTGPAFVLVSAVAVDALGNVHVAGQTSGDIDAGGGGRPAFGGGDSFIASFSPTGAHRYSVLFGEAAGDDRAFAIAVDDAGNVYVSGDFQGQLPVGGEVLTAVGTRDIFVASYDNVGNPRWARSFGAPSRGAIGFDLAARGTEVYLTGWFGGAVDFGLGSLDSGAESDAMLVRMSTADGTTLTADAIGGVDREQGQSIDLDGAGNVYLGGGYMGAGDFGAGVDPAVGGTDLFVYAADASFARRWSVVGGGSGFDRSVAIGVSSRGDAIYHAGTFEEAADLTGPFATLSSAGARDGYLARHGGDGSFRWAVSVGSTADSDQITAVDVASDGSVVVIAEIFGTVTLAGNTIDAPGGRHGLAAVFDPDGQALWAVGIGASGNDQMRDMAVGPNQEIVVGGAFFGDADFGDGPVSAPSGDAFVVVYRR